MTIDELYALLPETRREEAKAAIAEMSKGYVKIDGPDIAAKVMGENQYLKSILESETSKRVENHDTKFRAEKLPGIVEDEIKKRAPPSKNPEIAAAESKADQAIAEMAKWKADAIRERQRARAIAALSAKKLPETLADDFIGQTDDETDAKLKRFAEAVEPWVKTQVDSGVMGRIGNQGTPPAGNPPVPQDLEAQWKAAMAAGDADKVLALQLRMNAMPGA
jgi:hypothetical protein